MATSCLKLPPTFVYFDVPLREFYYSSDPPPLLTPHPPLQELLVVVRDSERVRLWYRQLVTMSITSAAQEKTKHIVEAKLRHLPGLAKLQFCHAIKANAGLAPSSTSKNPADQTTVHKIP